MKLLKWWDSGQVSLFGIKPHSLDLDFRESEIDLLLPPDDQLTRDVSLRSEKR